MNAFDTHIIEFCNRFAQRSHAFDQAVVTLDSDLFKGGVMIALVWWVWFTADETDGAQRRSVLLSALGTCIVAVFVARGLAHVLPFRERPIYTPGFDFVRPFGADDID